MKFHKIFSREISFLIFIPVTIAVFFIDLVTLEKGFLSGDHLAQHFPWAAYLQESIRRFELPWWCPFNQCGFPLLAEGQVGAFYPPNLIFLGLAPLPIAYNYEVLFHYLVGGFGFYFFVRRLGLSPSASFLGTLLFLFGSAQGGFSYNITSHRVLSWFPLALLLADILLKCPKAWKAACLALVLALQAVAGYQQFSIYFYGFVILYFGFRWFDCRSAKSAVLFVLALLLSIGLSLPQWIPFIELSQFSSRAQAQEELAYVGSMNPFGFFTLFFPAWQGFLGTGFYISILGIFLVLAGLRTKKDMRVWAIIVMLALSLLYALGKFNPLYVAFVKLTHLHFFRVPAKVLFFSSFSLAVLGAVGFQNIREVPKRMFQIFLMMSLAVLAGFAAMAIFLRTAEGWFYPIAENYVRTHIVGSAVHPHSLEIYLEKLRSFYDILLWQFNICNPRSLQAIVLILAGIWIATRRRTSWLILAVIMIDLFLFGLFTVKGNYESFETTRPKSRILEIIRQDPERARVYCFISQPHQKAGDQYPSFPNFNVFHKIEDVGVYSPFVMREYKKYLGGLGSVNDSLFAAAATAEVLKSRRSVLDFLNVKYVLSDKPLEGFVLLTEEKGIYLYENISRKPRYMTAGSVRELERGPRKLKLELIYRQADELAPIYPPADKLIVSEVDYPGWKAFVDGKEQGIKTVEGLFRSLEVPVGTHEIEFRYDITHFYWTFIAAGLSLGVCLLCLILRY